MKENIPTFDPGKEYLDWNDIEMLVNIVISKIKRINKKYDTIISIKDGGIIPAKLISKEMNIKDIAFISLKRKQIIEYNVFRKNKKYLVVDEIYDTGKTFSSISRLLETFEYDFVCLIIRYPVSDKKVIFGKILNNNKWVVFPWEKGWINKYISFRGI